METHKALSDNTPIFDKVVKCMKNMGNIDDFTGCPPGSIPPPPKCVPPPFGSPPPPPIKINFPPIAQRMLKLIMYNLINLYLLKLALKIKKGKLDYQALVILSVKIVIR